jgi:hypothetical protein
MAKRKIPRIIILFLTGLMFMGLATNGYSQQVLETSSMPVAGQKQPTERQPFQNRFQWQAGLEVIADLHGDKLAYTGDCPTVFTFKGSIYSNRAMTVHYRFLRSDDVRTTPVALTLAKDEKKDITYSWELGGPGGPSEFNAWVLLQAIYPTNMKSVSNVVNFKINCTNRKEKSAQDVKGQDFSGQQKAQGVPGLPFTGFSAQLPEGKGPASIGPSITQPGQQGQSVTDGPPGAPSGQGGKGPGGLPPIGPVQKGPVPGGPSMASGEGLLPDTMLSRNQQGQAVALKEDCISFNPDTTTMEQTSLGWRVMDGNQIIFGFDFDKTEAMVALATIKHYKITQSCFVGRPRPSFHYLLVGGSSPVGSFRPTDCSPFNPATTNVEQINGSWKVADGSNWLFDFGEKKDEADQTLAIIRKYGFTYSCMIVKGKVEYVYMHR